MLLDGVPIISEFQAINESTIADEDGETSDWIEIQNPDSEPLELVGWYLTDDAANLTKWQFPSTQLAPRSELIVFASSKDRTEGQLHTNFRLDGDGEYLALVRPDGVTVVQDFGASFPPQRPDQSYGLAQDRESTVLVDGESAVTAVVPRDDSLGLDWTQVEFNDDTWQSGIGAVGFEELREAQSTREEFDSPLSTDWTIDIPDSATGVVEVLDGGVHFSVPADQDATSFDRGLAPIVYREVPFENSTEWEFIAHITKDNPGDRGSVGIMIFDEATGKPALMLEQSVRQRFALVSGSTEFAWTQRQTGSFFLRMARNEFDKTYSAYAKLGEADEWNHIATVRDGTFEGAVVAEPRLAMFARSPVGTIDAKFESIEIVVDAQRPTYGPLIGLDVGQQMSGVNSSIYLRYPFAIDDDPNRFDVLGLGSRFDDGFDAYLNGDLISKNNSPVVAAWNSTAAGTHGAVLTDIPIAQDDVTDAIDLLRQGNNVLAIHGMNVSVDDADYFFEGGLVASRVLNLESREFTSPTPGAPNLSPAAPEPLLVGDDGVFFGAATMQFRLEEGAPDSLQIRYTLDGTEPTTSSNLYEAPFTISQTAVLQARTFDTLLAPNFSPSNIASHTFVALSEGLRDRESNIPLVVIDTLQQGIPDTNSSDLKMASIALLDVSRATSTASLNEGMIDYLGRGGVRRRGSSTGAQPKPQLALETWGPEGTNRDDDFDVSLLGLAPESDWVLHAPFGGDPAFMRNALGFELSNQMDRWAPKTRFVEVYINDNSGIVTESHYAGVYVLIEKIKPGSGRLDIETIRQSDNSEPNITGGYIWKVDRPDPDAPAFPAGGGTLNWVYPESPESLTANANRKATREQQRWVQDHFDAFADTLVNPDINDPNGYSKYIDVDAWIDYHLMQVVMYNADALGLSIFFHKDRNEKIAAGPLWDLNLTAESTRIDDDDPNLWLTGANFFGAAWWKDLVRDPGFWQRYVDRFQMWRDTVLSDENLQILTSTFRYEIGDSADRDAARWPDNSFRSVSGFNSGYLDGTFAGEVSHMQQWLFARMKFLERLFTGPPEILMDGTPLGDVPGALVAADQEIQIVSAPISRAVDERLVSGVPGETIARYFLPSDDSLGNMWTQPDFDDAAWDSGPTGIGFERRDNFEGLIETTLDPTEFADGATNIFARIPFEIENLDSIGDRDMVLRMQFEDGYIAHLNGVLVARDHVNGIDASWDTRAVNRSTDDAVEFEEIDITRFKHLLVQGTNVLAIRGMNSSPSSGEMLLVPELVLRSASFERRADARIYYTLDGTDPRGPNGNPSDSAIEFPLGSLLAINENTRVIARSLDRTNRGDESVVVRTDWSAPIQYDFVTASVPLTVSEINFNPAAPSVTESAGIPDADKDGTPDWTAQDFEFIEVFNPNDTAVDLTGIAFVDGVEFDFFDASVDKIDAGGYGIVVSNQQAFELRYGTNLPLLGEFEGGLNNDGERLELVDGTGSALFVVNYDDADPWPVRTDGVGATLVLTSKSTPLAEQNKSYSWRGSTNMHGTPGQAAEAPIGVVINEVLANSARPRVDSVELFNASDLTIDIGGWHLSDSAVDIRKFRIPSGTSLGAGQYIVFDESDFNSDPNNPSSFALNGDRGDSVWLTAPGGNNSLMQFVDDVHFNSTRPDESIGRIPNAVGRLAPLRQRSFGSANGDHRVGSMVISEFNYNPERPSEAALRVDSNLNSGDLEFIELHNQSDQSIDLIQWQIRGGVEFDFPTYSVTALETLLLVRFDPEDPENSAKLGAFKVHYGIDNDVAILGGLSGQLSNNQDKILLLSAEPAAVGNPVILPRVHEDEVVYDDLEPWDSNADGLGHSLHRINLDSYGNAAISWLAMTPNPGEVGDSIRGDLNGDGVVDATDIDSLAAAVRSGDSDIRFDLSGDQIVDAVDRDILVQDVLQTNYGDTNLDGIFNSRDLVNVFIPGEYEDDIQGNSTWVEGDWNGDGDFGTRDLVLAFMSGKYVAEAKDTFDKVAAAFDRSSDKDIRASVGPRDRPREVAATDSRHRSRIELRDAALFQLF